MKNSIENAGIKFTKEGFKYEILDGMLKFYTQDGGTRSISVKCTGGWEYALSKWVKWELEELNESKWRKSFDNLSMIDRLSHESFSHTRLKPYGVNIYFRRPCGDGVTCVGGWTRKEFDKIQHTIKNAPLLDLA